MSTRTFSFNNSGLLQRIGLHTSRDNYPARLLKLSSQQVLKAQDRQSEYEYLFKTTLQNYPYIYTLQQKFPLKTENSRAVTIASTT